MGADPKSAKRQSSCKSFFAPLGSVSAKAACRMLMKLTLGVLQSVLAYLKAF